MMNLIYNIQTGETSYEEVADVKVPTETIVEVPTESERIKALEDTMLDVLLGGVI